MPESIASYLQLVGAQIRWKRAVLPLTEELKTHLFEQKEACIAQGMDETAAEAEALVQMGDPRELGMALDRVHRPSPQWRLLVLIASLAGVGGLLRASGGWYYPARVCVCLGLGSVCLILGYLLDYNRLGRYAGALCLTVLTLSVFTEVVMPRLGWSIYLHGINYYAGYLTQLFPFAYALAVYRLRGKGWAGFAAAVGLAALTVLAGVLPGRLSGGVIVGICAGAVLCLAVKRDWFGPCHRAMYGTLGLCFLVPCLFLWLRYAPAVAERLAVALHPERDALGRGYLSNLVRKTLGSLPLWGESASPMIPEEHTTYLLAFAARRWGRIPFAALCAALTILFLLILVRCLDLRNPLGSLLAISTALSMGFRIIFYIACNLGYHFMVTDCPLISGNLTTVIDMALLGILLSALRQRHLPEAISGGSAAKTRRLRWNNGELTISFRKGAQRENSI